MENFLSSVEMYVAGELFFLFLLAAKKRSPPLPDLDASIRDLPLVFHAWSERKEPQNAFADFLPVQCCVVLARCTVHTVPAELRRDPVDT